MESACKREHAPFYREREAESPFVKNLGAMYATTMATPDVPVPVITFATPIATFEVPMAGGTFSTPTDTPDIPMGGVDTFATQTDTPDGEKKHRGKRGGRRSKGNNGGGLQSLQSLRLEMAGYSSKPMNIQTPSTGQKRDQETAGLSPEPRGFLRTPPTDPKGWRPVESAEDYVPLSLSLETQNQAEKMYMNITPTVQKHGNGPIPTPAMDLAKEIGLLNENVHDFAVFKDNFNRAYICYTKACEVNKNDSNLHQKFRILHGIDDALEEKGEQTWEELKAVLEKIDRFEGPVSAGMSGNQGKEAWPTMRVKSTDKVYTPKQLESLARIDAYNENRVEAKAKTAKRQRMSGNRRAKLEEKQRREEARGAQDEPELVNGNVPVAAEDSAKKEAPQQLSKKQRKKANKRAKQEELERRLLQTRAEKRREKQEKQRAARELQEEQLKKRNEELTATDDSDLEQEVSGNAPKRQRKSRRLKENEKKRREEKARELLEGKEKLSYGEMYEIEVAKVRSEMTRQLRLQADREAAEKVEKEGAMDVDG